MNVEGDTTKVVVLYPVHGVTKLQKMQLHSVESENVVVAGKFRVTASCLNLHIGAYKCC